MSKSKICKDCSIEKDWSEFHNHKRKLDGKSNLCRTCTRKREVDHVKKFKPVSEKECRNCKIIKSSDDFHKNSGKRSGLCEWCKVCRNVDKVEKRHGLESGELLKMKEEVDYKCEICYNKLPLAVDHCHKNGHVRGMLCSNCNQGLGRFKDNMKYLDNAIAYLKEKG